MEEFCGEPLLSLSSAWHTSSPRLSQCLSRTVSTYMIIYKCHKETFQVLLVPPSVILLFSILSSLFELKKHVSSPKVILDNRQSTLMIFSG